MWTIHARFIKGLSVIPIDKNVHMDDDNVELLKDPTPYRRLVEKLIYLLITRVDESPHLNL